MSELDVRRARPVGINHVAIEVGDLEEALEFYGALFEFDLRGRTDSSAFLDLGDQFLALAEVKLENPGRDGHRHFGLVVDDPGSIERRLGEGKRRSARTAPTSGIPGATGSRSSPTRRSGSPRRNTSSAA